MKAIHIFLKAHQPQHALLVDLLRHWKLYQNPVNRWIVVQRLHRRFHFFLCRRPRKHMPNRIHAHAFTRPPLHTHILSRSRIIAHQYRAESRLVAIRFPESRRILRNLPLFAKLAPAKLKLLAFTSERLTFDAGQVLFNQGDPGDAAFILIDGTADLLITPQGGKVLVATVSRNAIIGEIAILCDVPRTATVIAKAKLVTLRIDKENFFRLVTEFPQMAVEIMRVLARRLENTNEQLRKAVSAGAPA